MARTNCSSEFMNTFAKRLKTVRTYREITQASMAEKLKIDTRTYQNYEADNTSNLRVPNLEIVREMADILDCDISYLTGDNNENEFKKDTLYASDTTGLEYKTIEILETIKNTPKRDLTNYYDKNILFLLNFLIQHVGGRYILWNMFQYFFKSYNNVQYSDNSGSNSITLEDESLIDDRNISIFVDELSEQVFYSSIITGITKLKTLENTKQFNTSCCDYIPTKEEIQNEIDKIDKDICIFEKKEYKKFHCYTPEYALSLVHHDATGEWSDFPNLAKEVTSRIRLDIQNESIIEQLKRRKENCLYKLQKLYPIHNKYNNT